MQKEMHERNQRKERIGMKKNRLGILVGMCMSLLLLIFSAGAFAEELKMDVLNVGKADCILLECGEDRYMIDTGTAESWGRVSAVLKTEGITRLTGVIVTHTDSDHAGGVNALAASDLEIGCFYTSCFYTCKPNKHPVTVAAGRRGMNPVFLQAGDVLPLGSGTLTVLGPLTEDEKENNNSLVLMAEAEGRRFLLAGDMEIPEENSLILADVSLQADVLKVGNHAESDATGDAFAERVAPRIAVVSTNSAEEPDTPAVRVIRALNSVGAEVLYTQQSEKSVCVTADREGLHYAYASLRERPPKVNGVRIEKNTKNDSVRLINDLDSDTDLSGWFVLSERGGEIYIFPEGTILRATGELTVSALDSAQTGDLIWDEKKVWHKTKEDCAILCDVYGRIVSYD